MPRNYSNNVRVLHTKNQANQKKNYKIRRSKKTRMTYVTMIIVMIYMGIAIIKYITTDKLNYILANEGNINLTKHYEGIVTRDEEVILSPQDGYIQYLYPQGEKVKKSTIACRLRDKYYEDIIENKIDEVNNEIKNTQKDFSTKSAYQDDIYNMNNQLEKLINNYLLRKDSQRFDSIYNIKDKLNSTIKKRNDIYIIENNQKLYNLVTSKKHYENQLNNEFTDIYFKESGIISYAYDHYNELEENNKEFNLLTNENIDKKLINDCNKELFDIKLNERLIKKDEPLFKIIKSNNWNISFIINGELAKELEEKQYVNVQLDDMEHYVNARIKEIAKIDKNNYKVLLEMNSYLDKFLNKRIITLTFEDKNINGLKIPNSSILEKNVYAVPYNTIVRHKSIPHMVKVTPNEKIDIPVDIVFKDNQFVYIDADNENLSSSDAFLDNATDEKSEKLYNLESTLKLLGVYTINKGYKNFNKVDILYEGSDYTIIDNATPYGVKLYDRILQDADDE